MEAQLQQRHIRANTSLALATALAAALAAGVVGYAISTAARTPEVTPVEMAPGSGDDLASDIATTQVEPILRVPRSAREDDAFLAAGSAVITAHDGVQTSHMEQSESGAASAETDLAPVEILPERGISPR